MSHKFEATVDGIRFLYDGGEVEVDYNASNGDVVRLTIEPLEVKVTDGFRAAVKKACNCDSSSGGGSGGSGGGGAVAHATYTFDETTEAPASIVLDMTVDEIIAAEGNVSVVATLGTPDNPSFAVGRVAKVNEIAVHVIGIPSDSSGAYYTEVTIFGINGDGYPVWSASGSGPK